MWNGNATDRLFYPALYRDPSFPASPDPAVSLHCSYQNILQSRYMHRALRSCLPSEGRWKNTSYRRQYSYTYTIFSSSHSRSHPAPTSVRQAGHRTDAWQILPTPTALYKVLQIPTKYYEKNVPIPSDPLFWQKHGAIRKYNNTRIPGLLRLRGHVP